MAMANPPVFKYFLLALDALIVSVAFVISARFNATISAHPTLYVAMYGGLLVVTLVVFRMNDLYKRQIILTHYRQLVVVIKSLLIATVMIAMPVAFLRAGYFGPEGKNFFLGYIGATLVLFLFFRVLIVKSLLKHLASRDIYKSRLLVVGGDDTARYVAESLESDVSKSFTIVGFLDDYRPVGVEIYKEFRNLGSLEEIDAIIEKSEINEILIAIDDAPYERLIYIVNQCLRTGKIVRIYSNLLEVVAKKLNVEFYSAVPVIMLSQQAGGGTYKYVKRAIDIALSALGMIILSPVLLIVAAGIKLSSRGAVFFRQERVGKGGEPFSFIKFRSMHIGNDQSEHKEFVTKFISASDEDGKSDSEEKDDIQVFKITDDPRIFPFGRFIRKTSLDEFPQLYNVLRGEMSLVGPRPCLSYEWECYDDWHKNRLQILPGCTGLWQVLGRSSVTFEEMVILDLYYISNMSFWLDFRIVMHTFPVIFLARGGF
jgi:undecaprenyl-phosphate galactose phosphotransferase